MVGSFETLRQARGESISGSIVSLSFYIYGVNTMTD